MGWINLHLLREAGNSEPDQELKKKWLESRWINRDKIILAVDDRQKVVDMWRREQVTCLQCTEWEEFTPQVIIDKDKISKLHAYFDGACEPFNPGGHAGFGWLVKTEGVTLARSSGYMGHGGEMSNNVAEYGGAIAVMEYLIGAGLQNKNVHIYGDSKLVIYQMKGIYGAKGGLYYPYYQKALAIKDNFTDLKWHLIPREKNREADRMSKKGTQKRFEKAKV